MFDLYTYQSSVIKAARKAISQGKKHLIVASPTGSGKTVMFADVTNKAVDKGSRVLIVTDRTELLNQTSKTVQDFGSTPSFWIAGTTVIDRSKSVFIAMAQTLRNRVKIDEWYKFIKEEIDLVIIDEAHAQEFNYLFESGVVDDTATLGFTATPYRGGKMRQLGLDYEDIINGPSVKYLIGEEKLVNCDIYDCGAPDMKGVSMNYAKGDYNENQMFSKFNTSKFYKGLVRNYKKHTPNEKMIVFCCNIEHAIKTTKALTEAGFRAKFISSGVGKPKEYTGDDIPSQIRYEKRLKKYHKFTKAFAKFSGKRKEIFDGFKHNEFEILVNVDIATKGYDCPDIKVVALYRATQSLTLYLQMIGRGGRIFPGKTHFTVFDFGDNKSRFGGYDAERIWSLWHEDSPGGGVPPLKECGFTSELKKIKPGGRIKDGCRRLILASAQMCPICGFEYPEKNEAEEIDLQLAAIKDSKGVSLKSKSFKDMTFSELKKYREIQKHRSPWLWRQLWLRGEKNEITKFANKYHWNPALTRKAIQFCQATYR